ncbi:MAG: chromosomal replication initiator protein DnaA [Lentisphaeria bacterium]|jgi:chromosomal replication initiator protein|nr:chromosomal replication initiator protein DnaA [Lentisphaeria bacterium]MDY0176018.1 chromosomal replication initiator protein DnaA [Lentisphaeria bacterium]NLZ60838.1 chromosomal replication initiator protein DnaA [Lentisphaerota bacterium]
MQNSLSVEKVWQSCSGRIRQALDPATYAMWIADIVPLRLQDKHFVLGVSDNVFTDWLSDNYGELIASEISSELGCKTKILFEKGHEPELPEPEADAAPKIKMPPLEKTEPKRFNLRYTFDSFVVGDNNSFAQGACQAISSSPGLVYNPLFIHSPTGLGKTHLLQAVAQEVCKLKKNAKVEYLFSEEFCNLYIDAINRKTLPEFRSHFRNVDVLLIDDVHFFAGKDGLQEVFFHTFNALYNSRKQIVLTSDRPPSEIGRLEKRLVSRFECGLTVDIQSPNLETRIAILRQKQNDHSVKFSDKILQHLASRVKSNIRRLEGALLQLVYYITVTNRKAKDMSEDLADSLLAGLFAEEACSSINVEQIQRIVADYYDIRLSDMSSKRRPANIAFPRQIAMYFSRKLTTLSLPAIAEQFSRNHATILHAVNSIEEKMEESPDLRRDLCIIEKRLKN